MPCFYQPLSTPIEKIRLALRIFFLERLEGRKIFRSYPSCIFHLDRPEEARAIQDEIHFQRQTGPPDN